MNYGPSYNQRIEKTKKISRNLVETNKIYRLLSYEYADGSTKSSSGSMANIIFVFGIYKKEVHAIKLNMVKPFEFVKWLKSSSRKIVTEQMLIESDLPSLLKKSDDTGKAFFSSQIKGKSIYKIEPRAYRTYKLMNIKGIEEVYLKKDYLEEIFGKPNKTEEEVKDINTKKEIKPKETVERKVITEEQDASMDDFMDATMDILNKN